MAETTAIVVNEPQDQVRRNGESHTSGGHRRSQFDLEKLDRLLDVTGAMGE